MLEYFALFFSIISVIIMLIILFKFKKLFSTDSIIEKTRARMNQFITDINKNANADIELLNESTRRIRSLLKDADDKMQSFNEATQRLREMIAETEKITRKNRTKKVTVGNPIYNDINAKNVSYEKPKNKINPYAKNYIDPNSSYQIKMNNVQGFLFDENDMILKDETKVTADGAAYKEVPLIITKVYDDNVDIQNADNDLNEKVLKLFAGGMKVEEIAAKLNCSTSEVQFIIDMEIPQN